MVKKYGYRGKVTYKHIEAVMLHKKYLKMQELQTNSSRISKYMNHELIMIVDSGNFKQTN
jgi:hypothetical protein